MPDENRDTPKSWAAGVAQRLVVGAAPPQNRGAATVAGGFFEIEPPRFWGVCDFEAPPQNRGGFGVAVAGAVKKSAAAILGWLGCRGCGSCAR